MQESKGVHLQLRMGGGEMTIIDIKIKLEPGLYAEFMPCRKKQGDAGYDCRAADDVTLYPGKSYKIPLGFSMAIPPTHYAAMVPRSGLSLEGLRVLNSPGTIDSNYRGVVTAIVQWCGIGYKDIKKGDRIVQRVILPVPEVAFNLVDELDETDRGATGFGNSGLQ
jgi:dUTP pyrophosphatase